MMLNQRSGLVGKKIKTYSITKRIGAGTYSNVYQAFNNTNQQYVAIKCIPFQEITKQSKLKQLVQTEIKVLRSCKNDNVIKHIDSFMTSHYVFIVTEFCNGGDVQKYLDSRQMLKEEEANDILKQILNGFKGLHEVNAMHRDFKLANLLFHKKVIKIADLGFAKQLEQGNLAQTQLGTGLTMAPEVLDGNQYGMTADIWSIGVTYFQMLNGKYPFSGRSKAQIRKDIEKHNIIYNSKAKISDQAKDFIERCLTIDPNLRISWSQIYSHPLISNQSKLKINQSISKENLQSNKNYCSQNQLSAQKKFIYPQKQQYITQGQQINHIKPDEVKEQSNLGILKNQTEAKMKRDMEILEVQDLLLKKRNSIMFMFKYFIPKISLYVDKIYANHSLSLFYICKKTLIEMQNYVEEINLKRSIENEKQSSFKIFFESSNCQRLIILLLEDIQMIRQQSLVYSQAIDLKIPVAIELSDITKWQSANYQNQMKENMQSYWFQIAENLSEFLQNIPTTALILQMLKALEEYNNTDEINVNVDVFNVLIQTMDPQEYRVEVMRKMYDAVNNVR